VDGRPYHRSAAEAVVDAHSVTVARVEAAVRLRCISSVGGGVSSQAQAKKHVQTKARTRARTANVPKTKERCERPKLDINGSFSSLFPQLFFSTCIFCVLYFSFPPFLFFAVCFLFSFSFTYLLLASFATPCTILPLHLPRAPPLFFLSRKVPKTKKTWKVFFFGYKGVSTRALHGAHLRDEGKKKAVPLSTPFPPSFFIATVAATRKTVFLK
jgi:hypothetical protein